MWSKGYGLADLEARLPVTPGVVFPVWSVTKSVVYYPPSTTWTGRGMLSRNNDFMTGTFHNMLDLPAAPGVKAMIAEPYMMEVHPDEGYPSLYLCTFDLLEARGGKLTGKTYVRAAFGEAQLATELARA